jgi:hypothetical protein
MGTQLLVGAHMRAFAEEVDVLVGKEHSLSLASPMPIICFNGARRPWRR